MPAFTPCIGIRIPECGKFLFVENGILGFGILNTAQGTQNPTKDWDPESKFHRQKLDLDSMVWNPESKTVLDSLTQGDNMRMNTACSTHQISLISGLKLKISNVTPCQPSYPCVYFFSLSPMLRFAVIFKWVIHESTFGKGVT